MQNTRKTIGRSVKRNNRRNLANKPVLLSNLKVPIKLILLEEISDHPKSLLQGLKKPLAHLAPDFYLQKQNMFEEIEKFYKT